MPNDFYNIRTLLTSEAGNNIDSIYENVVDGRELSAYNVTFSDINGNSFNIFNLDSVDLLYRLLSKDDAVIKSIYDSAIIQDNLEIIAEQFQKESAHQLTDFSEMLLPQYVVYFKKIAHKFLLQNAQNDFFILSNMKSFSKDRMVYVNGGNQIEVNPDSVEVFPYELVMPKVNASNFGLSENADLQSIINDPDYFIKQSINKLFGESKLPD